MNATKKLAAAIIFLVAASAFTLPALIKNENSNGGQNQNAVLVLYYGITCPHCKIVEQYIKDNGLSEKLDIAKKEVYQNQTNQEEFVKIAGICGLDKNNLVVPMLWDSKTQKCYQGKELIIDFLKDPATLGQYQ